MTKPRYKHTWLMGILLAILTLTSPPTPAVGPLIGILVEIGKGVLTEVVLDMLQEEPGKDTEGLEIQANPDQIDAAQQAKLVLKAAKQGDAKAQFAMAIIFYEGLGVSKNEEQAVSWMTKSASQGFAKAQFGLGLMYESGIGVNIDNEQAVEWYMKAADQGFAEAQFNLGTMYSSGLGVDRNPILAYQWFSLAANQGHQNAKQEQASLRQQLSLQEVNEANRLTKHWLAEHNGKVARSESPKTRLSMSSESEDDSENSPAPTRSASLRPAGFNCAKASTKVEKLICGDPRLSDADGRLHEVFAQQRQALSEADAKQLQQAQRQWLKVRNQRFSSCGDDIDCAVAVYEERITEIQGGQSSKTRLSLSSVSEDDSADSPAPTHSASSLKPAGFNCAKASTKVEKFICDNPRLSDADGRLHEVFSEQRQALPEADAKQLQQAQRQWLKVRNQRFSNCGDDIDCAVAVYEERITEIQGGQSSKTRLSMSSESEDDSKSDASDSVQPASTEKWLVILGTYPNNQSGKAQQRLNLLENSGYHDASIEESDNYPNLKKGLFIVVRGPFSKNQAESVKEEMSAVIPDVYIKLDGR